jgi:hypothetical protein
MHHYPNQIVCVLVGLVVIKSLQVHVDDILIGASGSTINGRGGNDRINGCNGNWTIGVNNGNAALVTANMTWYNDSGTASHTHEILNFRPFAAGQEQQPIVVQPYSRNVSLKGTVDVGANHRIAWNGVQSTIDIKKGGRYYQFP